MSGRRTWMPEEAAAARTDTSQENPAVDNPVDGQQAGVQETQDTHQAQQAPETRAPHREESDASSGPESAKEPKEPNEGKETALARSGREWVPGQTGGKLADTPAGSKPAPDGGSGQYEDTSVMDGAPVRGAASVHQTRAREEENADAVHGGAQASGTATAADADTTDIPITPRARREKGSENPEAGNGQDRGAERGGMWSSVRTSVRNRISGKGPLSPEREARAEREKEEPAIEPGGSMDPNERMQRLSSSIKSGDHEPSTAVQEEEDEREGLAGSGPLLWLIDHWIPIAVPLVLVCIGIFVFATIFTNGQTNEEIASSEGGSGEGKGKPSQDAGNGTGQVPLYESGLVFDYTQKDGKATLKAGDLTWEGEVTEGGEDSPKEAVTLAGPTAAKINRGYEMDGGSDEPGQVETMTYAVEAEDAPDIHATYQRFSGHTSKGPVEAPNGSYSVTADSGDLIAEGNYSDRRTGGGAAGEDGNEVIRTYTENVPGEGEPQQFRARYEAPEGAPVPALVGWQEPEARNSEDEGNS